LQLSEFIAANTELVIREWEAFAKKLNSSLPRWLLRDHASAIVKLLADQTKLPLVPEAHRTPDSVEQVTSAHVQVRIESGFDLAQIIGEYLALRSCVLRMWRQNDLNGFANGAAEIARFTEVIDENVASAALFYREQELQYRDRFLGILGHDLRTPISAVLLSATVLSKEISDEKQLATISRILNSSRRLTGMVDDLLDFARGRLGVPMPLKPSAADLRKIILDVIDENQAAYPGTVIHFETEADLNGEWDVERLKQLLSNLLINAIQHGTPDSVKARAKEENDSVLIEVENQGPPIAQELIPVLFDPLVRGAESDQEKDNLGLGLFIAKEIAGAHHGTITVTSSVATGTIFAVRLPRNCR
jgi:signal transduction histidine kinase